MHSQILYTGTVQGGVPLKDAVLDTALTALTALQAQAWRNALRDTAGLRYTAKLCAMRSTVHPAYSLLHALCMDTISRTIAQTV